MEKMSRPLRLPEVSLIQATTRTTYRNVSVFVLGESGEGAGGGRGEGKKSPHIVIRQPTHGCKHAIPFATCQKTTVSGRYQDLGLWDKTEKKG